MEENLKPNLIEPEYFKKIYKTNNIKKYSFLENISQYCGNSLIYFAINYGDLVLAILVLFIILFFRYKYFSNEKNVKKNEVIINYIRDQNIENGRLVDSNDRIESDINIDQKIIDTVKDEIKKVDKSEFDLKSFNFDTIDSAPF